MIQLISLSPIATEPETMPNEQKMHVSKIKHVIQWITSETSPPYILRAPIDANYLSENINWEWIKLDENKLVTHTDSYLITESDIDTSLIILKYDNKTHAQLSAYEPLLVQHVGSQTLLLRTNFDKDEEFQRHLFTLAYLKSHAIISEKFDNNKKHRVKCVADFYVAKFYHKDDDPSQDEAVIASIMGHMKKQAIFKMTKKSTKTPNEEITPDDDEATIEPRERVNKKQVIVHGPAPLPQHTSDKTGQAGNFLDPIFINPIYESNEQDSEADHAFSRRIKRSPDASIQYEVAREVDEDTTEGENRLG